MDYPIPADFQGYEPIKPRKMVKLQKNDEQSLKYYNHQKEGIQPEKAYHTDAGFDLRYPGKKPLILEPHTITKIDLKIAVEIPEGTMMQLASPWTFLVIYLDDTNIHSPTFGSHLDHLQQTFDRLQKAGLRLNIQKCHFCKESLEFLGHVIGKDGIKPDPAKIEKVVKFPQPTNLTTLRGFL
ncbi:9999_t:CDS:2, partial [Ambispora gerdemannii]